MAKDREKKGGGGAIYNIRRPIDPTGCSYPVNLIIFMAATSYSGDSVVEFPLTDIISGGNARCCAFVYMSAYVSDDSGTVFDASCHPAVPYG